MKKKLFVLLLCVLFGAFCYASSNDSDDDGESTDTETMADSPDDAEDGDMAGDGESSDEDDDEDQGEDYADNGDDQSGDNGQPEAQELTDFQVQQIVDFLSALYSATDRFISALPQINDAGALADSIRGFAQEIAPLREQARSFDKLFSSGAIQSSKSPEIQDLMRKIEQLGSRMQTLGSTIERFSSDQRVLDAVAEMNKVTN